MNEKQKQIITNDRVNAKQTQNPCEERKQNGKKKLRKEEKREKTTHDTKITS